MLIYVPIDNWRPPQCLRWKKGKKKRVVYLEQSVLKTHKTDIQCLFASLAWLGFKWFSPLLISFILKPKNQNKEPNQNVLTYYPWPQITVFPFPSLKVILLLNAEADEYLKKKKPPSEAPSSFALVVLVKLILFSRWI